MCKFFLNKGRFCGGIIPECSVFQVVLVLKKEVASTSNGGASSEGASESGDMAGYRQSLVKTLHSCSIKFPSVAPSVVPLVSQLSFDL